MRNLGVLDEEPAEPKEDEQKQNAQLAETPKKDEFKPKKKSRAQRRIEAQQRTIKELRAKLEAQQSQQKPEVKPVENKNSESEPDVDDFDSYEDYLEALEKYEASLENTAPVPDTKQKEVQTDEKQGKQDVDTHFADRIAEVLNEGKQEFADFEKVVMKDDLPLSQELLNEVIESDYAPEILYKLGGNPKMSEELSLLSQTDPERLKREIVKLEVKLEEEENGQTQTKKITKAPEPINPVEGTSALSKSVDDEDLSFNEYEELMKKKQNQERGGFL